MEKESQNKIEKKVLNQNSTDHMKKRENMKKLHTGKAFRLEQSEALGLLNFDLEGSRVNKFDGAVLNELSEVLDLVNKEKSIKALVIQSAKKGSFIVGADIQVIQSIKEQPEAEEAAALGQKVFSELEDLGIPTLAAIDGPAMGGGTELCLACDFRVCSDSSKTMIALPETKLGLLPGWGGTYRLPRLVGLMGAVDMILSGKNIRAAKAKKMKLVDEVIPSEFFNEKVLDFGQALSRGEKIFKSARKKKLQEKLLTENFLGKKIFYSQAKKQLLEKTKGHYPAQERVLELMEKKSHLKRDQYMKEEAVAFSELAMTDVSKNLIRLFFLMEANKKDYGVSLSSDQIKALSPIQNIGVLGAGVMGGGIAYQSAAKAFRVLLKDIQFSAVSSGLKHARSLFAKLAKKRIIKKSEVDLKLDLIQGQIDYAGFKNLDLVIEAVVENLEVKKKVFTELETKVNDQCLIASNTSSICLSEMLPAIQRKENFVGLHFFNPVHKMPLVEIIRTEHNTEEVVARAVHYVKSIGKTALVCKDGPGFLVNRLLLPWLVEVGYCLEEGCDIPKLDREVKKFGMPMGAFELMDEVGLDTVCKIGPIFHKALGERFEGSSLIQKIIEDSHSEKKRYGKKTGLGFYTWEKGRKKDLDLANIEKLIGLKLDGKNFKYSGQALQERLFFPMINEVCDVLKEKIVKSPEDVDLGVIFGIGFPPFKGGLCRWADSVGLDYVCSRLEELSKVHGARLAPTESLKAMAANKERFYTEA